MELCSHPTSLTDFLRKIELGREKAGRNINEQRFNNKTMNSYEILGRTPPVNDFEMTLEKVLFPH